MPQLITGGAAVTARLARNNAVYVASFIMDAAMAFGNVGSFYLASDAFKADTFRLGLLQFISAGSYFFFCLIFGRLSDKWGRRKLIAAGAIIDIVALALAAQAGGFWELCVWMALFSAGQGAFWPSVEADIADHSTPLELPRRLGKFNVAWCMGFVAGMPAAGFIGAHASQPTVLMIGSALTLLALLVHFTRQFAPESISEPQHDEATLARAAVRAAPFWLIALIMNFAAMGITNTLRSLVPKVSDSAQGGIYGACFFGAQVTTFILLGLWRGWHFRAAPLVIATVLGAGGATLCGLSNAPWSFAAGCLAGGIGCGITYFSSIYYSVAASSARGHRGGIHEAVLGGGGAVIPFAGGAIAALPWVVGLGERGAIWQPGVPFLVAGAFFLLAAIIGAFIYLRMRRSTAANGG